MSLRLFSPKELGFFLSSRWVVSSQHTRLTLRLRFRQVGMHLFSGLMGGDAGAEVGVVVTTGTGACFLAAAAAAAASLCLICFISFSM